MSSEKEKREKNIDKIISNNETAQVRGIKTERIKSVRNRFNLTQQKFAEEIDVSLDTIKAIELNEDKLSLDVALRIAKRFNVSLDYLFNITDFMNEDEILIDRAFESIFDVSLIHKEDYIDIDGKMYSTDILSLIADDYLIQFLYESKRLEKKKNNNEISQDEYDFKMEYLKDKYYQALNKNVSEPSKHYLINADFAEKLFNYELTTNK